MKGTDGAGSPRLTADQENRLADYRAGRMSPEASRAFERDVLSDDDLASALYGDVNLSMALDEVAAGAMEAPSERKVVKNPRGWNRRFLPILVPLAVAALVLLVMFPPERDRGARRGEPTFRGAESSVQIIRPVGVLDDVPTRFVWTLDSGAAMYRVELYDSSARLLHRSTTSDTILVLPQGVLSDGAFEEGYWKVIPMNDVGVERPSPSPMSIRMRRP